MDDECRLPSSLSQSYPVAATSSRQACAQENDERNKHYANNDEDNLIQVGAAAVREISLSESCATDDDNDDDDDEVPSQPSAQTKPSRRRRPRGGGSKRAPMSISETLPIDETQPLHEEVKIASQQEQKDEQLDRSDLILSSTTTTNKNNNNDDIPQPSQQHPKQTRSRRRRKKTLDTKSDQQQQHQEEQQEQEHQQQQQREEELEKYDENDQKENDEDDVHNNEDEDDYPSSMGIMAAATTESNSDHPPILPQNLREDRSNINHEEMKVPKRTIMEELTFLKRISPTRCQVELGFVPNMKVRAEIIVNDDLQTLLVHELRESSTCCSNSSPESAAREAVVDDAFIPSLRQVANVAALPGIVGASLAMPDVHSGYGFCIGNVAAFDMEDPLSIISPGGVGFDINCGVRLIRTNLTESDVSGTVREELADAMFRNIPVGVGVNGDIPCNMEELDTILREGINWAIGKGYAWKEDRDHCEDNGRMDTADPKCVSNRAKRRGLKQLGTLGAGNHYAEIQVVDEIYNIHAASTMGIGKIGQVCIMIHTGSRGLGHQVATDALTVMERAMARDRIELNDRQLSCARISSQEGTEYLSAMSSAANFAWVNRSCITYLTRKSFAEVFHRTPDEMDMHLVYDVCHNIAKIETHVVDGVEKKLLVHRKGSTRAFPPHHPNIPKDYQSIGQPVLIGGTMGTCSYVLVGTERGMSETFGSTCHGAGRALSRNQSRKTLDHTRVLDELQKRDIVIRVASPKLITEEAPESYKNVCDVIETCQDAGISEKVVKLRPIAVIKG